MKMRKNAGRFRKRYYKHFLMDSLKIQKIYNIKSIYHSILKKNVKVIRTHTTESVFDGEICEDYQEPKIENLNKHGKLSSCNNS